MFDFVAVSLVLRISFANNLQLSGVFLVAQLFLLLQQWRTNSLTFVFWEQLLSMAVCGWIIMFVHVAHCHDIGCRECILQCYCLFHIVIHVWNRSTNYCDRSFVAGNGGVMDIVIFFVRVVLSSDFHATCDASC